MRVFGPFRLDTANHCLWRAQERASLTPKAFDVLRYLVEHANRLVTQDELLEALWPETYVNPEGIRKYILEIRKALGDRSKKPAFIETFPKRGYQFVAPVTDDSKSIRLASTSQPCGNVVGRQEGLARLDGYLQAALGGRRQAVFVTGEAGIGKTTLVDVFQQHAICHPDLRIARGQCIEGFGGIEAYYPMLEALGSLLRGAEDGHVIETIATRAPTWLVQFPGLVKPEQREALEREILGSTRERMVREICVSTRLPGPAQPGNMAEKLMGGTRIRGDCLRARVRLRSDRTDSPKDSTSAVKFRAYKGVHLCDDYAAVKGVQMRSPDLPEILIGAGLVACIASAIYNWFHRRVEPKPRRQ